MSSIDHMKILDPMIIDFLTLFC